VWESLNYNPTPPQKKEKEKKKREQVVSYNNHLNVISSLKMSISKEYIYIK
jgi:hypothetical protein